MVKKNQFDVFWGGGEGGNSLNFWETHSVQEREREKTTHFAENDKLSSLEDQEVVDKKRRRRKKRRRGRRRKKSVEGIDLANAGGGAGSKKDAVAKCVAFYLWRRCQVCKRRREGMEKQTVLPVLPMHNYYWD